MVLKETSFDVVIATRNRYDALALSVPLILSEKRQPKNLIVVDSSDNNEQIKSLILTLTANWPGKVVVLSAPPGLTRQRNLGLAYVKSDVVIFPDDDSLILPGAFEHMMRIYDLDIEGKIAGVCSAEEILPPDGLLDGSKSYALTSLDRITKKVIKVKNFIERRIIPDALLRHGRGLIKKHKQPSWLASENAIPVEFMTGFRMSYRSSVINRYKFSEVFSGYCLGEDTGASFLALREGLLIGARNAKIYHHKYPAKRANGYDMGLMQVINFAYVLSNSMQKFEAE